MSGKAIPSSPQVAKIPESAYGTPSEPLSAAEAAATIDRSSLSPLDASVPPSLQPAAYAKASAVQPVVASKVPDSIAQTPAPALVADAPPRAPAQVPVMPSAYQNEWRVSASSVLSPSPLPGEEPAIEVAQGGQPAPDGGGGGGPTMGVSRNVGSEQAMEATPTTHEGWVPFIHLYFCVLFIILVILVAYIAIAIKQSSEVTTLGSADLPSNKTSLPLLNVTDDEFQRTAGESLSLKAEVETVTSAVVAEEGEASTSLEGDEEGSHDSSRQLDEQYKKATTTAFSKNVTDVDDAEAESESFETPLPRLRPEYRSTAAAALLRAELIREADFNASLSETATAPAISTRRWAF